MAILIICAYSENGESYITELEAGICTDISADISADISESRFFELCVALY